MNAIKHWVFCIFLLVLFGNQTFVLANDCRIGILIPESLKEGQPNRPLLQQILQSREYNQGNFDRRLVIDVAGRSATNGNTETQLDRLERTLSAYARKHGYGATLEALTKINAKTGNTPSNVTVIIQESNPISESFASIKNLAENGVNFIGTNQESQTWLRAATRGESNEASMVYAVAEVKKLNPHVNHVSSITETEIKEMLANESKRAAFVSKWATELGADPKLGPVSFHGFSSKGYENANDISRLVESLIQSDPARYANQSEIVQHLYEQITSLKDWNKRLFISGGNDDGGIGEIVNKVVAKLHAASPNRKIALLAIGSENSIGSKFGKDVGATLIAQGKTWGGNIKGSVNATPVSALYSLIADHSFFLGGGDVTFAEYFHALFNKRKGTAIFIPVKDAKGDYGPTYHLVMNDREKAAANLFSHWQDLRKKELASTLQGEGLKPLLEKVGFNDAYIERMLKAAEKKAPASAKELEDFLRRNTPSLTERLGFDFENKIQEIKSNLERMQKIERSDDKAQIGKWRRQIAEHYAKPGEIVPRNQLSTKEFNDKVESELQRWIRQLDGGHLDRLNANHFLLPEWHSDRVINEHMGKYIVDLLHDIHKEPNGTFKVKVPGEKSEPLVFKNETELTDAIFNRFFNESESIYERIFGLPKGETAVDRDARVAKARNEFDGIFSKTLEDRVNRDPREILTREIAKALHEDWRANKKEADAKAKPYKSLGSGERNIKYLEFDDLPREERYKNILVSRIMLEQMEIDGVINANDFKKITPESVQAIQQRFVNLSKKEKDKFYLNIERAYKDTMGEFMPEQLSKADRAYVEKQLRTALDSAKNFATDPIRHTNASIDTKGFLRRSMDRAFRKPASGTGACSRILSLL